MGTLVATTLEDRVSGDSSLITDLQTGWTKIATQTASASASIDFTSTHITSTYTKYCFVLEDIRPATDNVSLLIRVSQGSGFLSDATYHYHTHNSTSNASTYGGGSGTTATAMVLATAVGNDASAHISGNVWLYAPANTATLPSLHWEGQYYVSTNFSGGMLGNGFYAGGTGACDGVQFLTTSGNLADGSITLYGIK